MIDIGIWRKINANIRHQLRQELGISRTGSFIIESPSNRILDDGVTQNDLNKVEIKTLQDFAESTEEDVELLLQIIIDKRYEKATKVKSSDNAPDDASGKSESTEASGGSATQAAQRKGSKLS